jgi:protein-S-isoprenylcysteine O-methyltransferase Ste14
VARMGRDRVCDVCARALVGTLFTLLSIKILAEFLRTGHITGLLLLASEALVVILTILRRRAQFVDRSVAAAVVTTLSMVGPPLLQTASTLSPLPDALTAVISALGLIIVVVGKLTLGRSFGLVPANRGVVVGGPYTLVRHPIYTGYLITHAGFLLAHPSLWNVIVLVVGDVALVVRALMEERTLSADEAYRGYCQRVEWHLVPGVF